MGAYGCCSHESPASSPIPETSPRTAPKRFSKGQSLEFSQYVTGLVAAGGMKASIDRG
jgi:hypothetical protein